MKVNAKLKLAITGLALSAIAGAAQADVLFWSTQAKPAQESQAMREQVLAGAGMAVIIRGMTAARG